MPQDFLKLLNLLADAGAEFVIVGGVAAFLHGGRRVTYDVDVVTRLVAKTWPGLIDAIWDAGGRPRIPETRESIKDVLNIEKWMRDKGMLALTFRSTSGAIEIDLLVQQSHRFEQLKARAKTVELGGYGFLVVSIDDLIEMKRAAGRPQDLLDIAELTAIKHRLPDPDRE